jgi:hypothetical protein
MVTKTRPINDLRRDPLEHHQQRSIVLNRHLFAELRHNPCHTATVFSERLAETREDSASQFRALETKQLKRLVPGHFVTFSKLLATSPA